MIEPGALVYFEHPKHSWTLGTVKTWTGKLGSCVSTDPKFPNEMADKLKEDSIFPISKEVVGEDVNDLLNLTILHDATLLNCLKLRYFKDVIYTNIGAIVVALNPFNFKIPHYMDDRMVNYLAEGDRIEKNMPHSWAVAHNTYFEMMNDVQNQCILVSGESGAGKTEASKIVMKYLGAISCKQGEDSEKAAAQMVGMKINKASPILEAFGNARTVRNDNSSRFGKFMKVQFSSSGFLVGAFVIKYLLEKSRIISAAKGERVYHSFYLMCRAKKEFRDKFSIGEDKSYVSLSSGKHWNNKEFDTEEDMNDVLDAMSHVGMSADEIDGVWSAVAGILHLENTAFLDDGEGSKLDPKTSQFVDLCCKCWQVDKEVMLREFNTTTLVVGGSKVVKQLRSVQAYDGRDALVKTVYDEEFGWLVEKINSTLDVESQCQSWVGLLDIFGFEDFETGNYFEQLCINLANETIQGHYNQYIFQKDMDECRAEGIDVAQIQFPDNTPCLNMIAGKGGVLALLDEECSLGKGTDLGFLDKISRTFTKNPFFLKKALAKNSFIIHHYAGSVSYDVTGALDKNRDTLKDAYKLMMRASTNPFMAELVPAPVEKAGKRMSVGMFFKNQLRELMDLINSTNPHWIRCIKPHPAKKPLMFDGVSTMNQLGSSGVLGTVKIRKAGYPVRLKFDVFWPRYRVVALEKGKGGDIPLDKGQEGSQLVFDTLGWGPELVQMGHTRVFLKAHAYVDLEKTKKLALSKSAIKIQAAAQWKLSLPIVRRQRWVVASKVIQYDWRDYMVRCAEIRKERERIRKELAEKHSAERKVLIEEGLGSLEPIYLEFEAPLAEWKERMHREAKEIERMLEEFGESRQAVRDGHARGAEQIIMEADLGFQGLQQQLLEMLLGCVGILERDARKEVERIEEKERVVLDERLEEGFAVVRVLRYLALESVIRAKEEELERAMRHELELRWQLWEQERERWARLLGQLLPACKRIQKDIGKYHRRQQMREELVRERQMLSGGRYAGATGRQFVQYTADGRSILCPINDKVADGGRPAWVGSSNVAAIDQAPRAAHRSKTDVRRVRPANTAAASPPSSPLSSPRGKEASNSTSLSPSRTRRALVDGPAATPSRTSVSNPDIYGPAGNVTVPKPAIWDKAPSLANVDPASGVDHSLAGASANALAKMGEDNPLYRSIFSKAREECTAQMKWLQERGAYAGGKWLKASEIKTLKHLRAAEAVLRKVKSEYCEKLRQELKRLVAMCEKYRVPERHPVTQQWQRMTPVPKDLLHDYPPTTDVFLVADEVARLSQAIMSHKEEVFRVLNGAAKQKIFVPTQPLDPSLPYTTLKGMLDTASTIKAYDNYMRCPSCMSFCKRSARLCWSCRTPTGFMTS